MDMKHCPAKQHLFDFSPHQSRSVPINLFLKDPEDKNSQMYEYCIDCRKYQGSVGKRYSQKQTALHEESKLANTGFLYCTCKAHDKISKHVRNKVPEALFRKYPDNVKSPLLKKCMDCRAVNSKKNRDKIIVKKEEAIKANKFYCTNCHKAFDESCRALNLDGSSSILCLKCKVGERVRSLNIRQTYKRTKLERLLEIEASCNKCKSLYIQDPDDSSVIVELRTFQENSMRYVTIEGQKFAAKVVIESSMDHLELDILQLDHLPVEEQMEKGLLDSRGNYVPKVKIVSKLSSEAAIKLEAEKCQLLCARCHVEETVARETGLEDKCRSKAERNKFSYTNKLKVKGCETCGYVNIKLLRFFHFDHIDPKQKTECVSRMVKDNKYSQSELEKEIAKCRILCGHCHIIHTRNQRSNGEI